MTYETAQTKHASQFTPHIVAIGGTLRAGSSCEKAVKFAVAYAEELGATTECFCGADLLLPPYDPGQNSGNPLVDRLLASLREADGIIIASPAYHGSISGIIKNVLDYTEEMRTDALSYLEGRSVGLIVSAAGMQGIGTTLTTLRSVVHTLRGWPTPYGVGLLSVGDPLFQGEQPARPETAQSLKIMTREVVDFAVTRLSVGNQAVALAV
ncbi:MULTISPECIES: NADPH-dependent FMN reductase [unclassified Rhizobium]|uniref:NADPH-dependent FMN reductase n=1 Tax=unclassified Rhizobium TaxID=2613769 RepID=UPI000BC744C6|nr:MULTISPECIES: NAD(P)H-dependent oxidoreductase [unclassified Rhizobium]MDH7809589.1 FMN reductase [Rhizobium sp. AN67]MDQ4408824.1 NAD(P)H-dependent oxidoreductase [Rhizobium sp. AN63]SOD50572.1 FMN reductase [Rhizobium sp. AN6A]